MMRWARGKTEKDLIKNEDMWRDANIKPMATVQRQKRLRWYDHVLGKEREDTTNKMFNMQVQGKRRLDTRKNDWTTSERT